MTWAPRAPSSVATRKPIPLPPPVTRTVRPSNRGRSLIFQLTSEVYALRATLQVVQLQVTGSIRFVAKRRVQESKAGRQDTLFPLFADRVTRSADRGLALLTVQRGL
jgi:hypothetical protein